MSDYIKKESFTEHIEDLFCKQCERRAGIKNGKKKFLYAIGDAPCRSCGIADVMEIFENFHVADVVERKHGKWVFGFDEETGEQDLYAWTCSLCGEKYPWQPNFCPNCGADMRGDSDV